MSNPINKYLSQRLAEIGLKPEENTRLIEHEGRPQTIPILSIDEKEDCICIPYVQPSGEAETYEDGKKTVQFSRKRYRVPKEVKDRDGNPKKVRYNQPHKTGVYSYMTPGIVRKYMSGETIKTLIVVEGEIKSLAGWCAGLDICAVGGIHNIKDKESNTLEENLTAVIEKCKVENIVYLVDADLFSIVYHETKDLTFRLKMFYSAICNFADLLKPFEVDVYFAHIDEKFATLAKGLDDLLSMPKIDREAVVKELTDLTTGNKDYFKIQPLRGGYADKLMKYFLLKSVAEFYERYKPIIQDREFKFDGEKYYFDGTKVVKAWFLEAKQYLRIGCEFYKKIWKINPHKEASHQKPTMILKPWSIGEINRDFHDNKKFITYIPKYDQFVNMPDNTKEYRRIIEIEHEGLITRCYNRYHAIDMEPAPGTWKHIEAFLRHIFGSENTKGESLYEFGIDWIQISFFNPKQRLPVLCPVSSERNTGKSTFLNFLKLIFGENMAVVDNERFTGKFTSHFVDKLIVALDEGFIPVEQKLMKERIKNYSTGRTVWLEGKGKDANEIDNFIHLIMCSNDESNFMQIDEGENRFAVLKVKTLTADDPNLVVKLETEVPAFIHHLSKRKLHYETDQSRFSFNTQVYETAALKAVMERTEKRLHKEIKEFLRDMFLTTRQKILYYTPKDLAAEMNESGNGFRTSKSDCLDYVKYELKKKPEPLMRYNLYRLQIDPYNPNEFKAVPQPSKPGTPYAFHVEDYLSDSDINSLNQ